MNRETKKLKAKKVKGRIKVLKVLPYKGSMVYIRMIGEDTFEYLLTLKKEIYSSYLIMKPKKGATKLTQDEVNQSAALIFAGAVTTIDTLKGDKLDKKAKEVIKTFEDHRQIFEEKEVIK